MAHFHYLPQAEVQHRFLVLQEAERRLADAFADEQMDGHRAVKRRKYIRWSILQHYGVSLTPLLDFTHSLRVACSFAQHDAKGPTTHVMVFGLPYVTNRISINSEHELVNVRLLSICPPDALRPYFQDGYLAGTDDVTTDYDPKTELDFKNRLIAKFQIPRSKRFWGEGFSSIPDSLLYPRGDRVGQLCEHIRTTLTVSLQPGQLGEFLQDWTELEAQLLERARRQESRPFTVRESINQMHKSGAVDEETAYRLNRVRKLRNEVVHRHTDIAPATIAEGIDEIRALTRYLRG